MYHLIIFILLQIVALAIPIDVHFNKDESALLELRNDGHAVLDLQVAQPIQSLQVHHEYREEEIKIFYLILDAKNVLYIATTHQHGLQVCSLIILYLIFVTKPLRINLNFL
jgi:hypothetical protein